MGGSACGSGLEQPRSAPASPARSATRNIRLRYASHQPTFYRKPNQVATGSYFLAYFWRRLSVTSDPYTLPAASAVTPSAAVVAGTGVVFHGSGISAVTLPSRALPI